MKIQVLQAGHFRPVFRVNSAAVSHKKKRRLLNNLSNPGCCSSVHPSCLSGSRENWLGTRERCPLRGREGTVRYGGPNGDSGHPSIWHCFPIASQTSYRRAVRWRVVLRPVAGAHVTTIRHPCVRTCQASGLYRGRLRKQERCRALLSSS